ncbi:hypothetical protein SAMN05444166_2863 [Singulisphaera sp. GP187]|nr:hypothetical protein SAMN05444166_2863 [Singulisphaera sp. GP187]
MAKEGEPATPDPFRPRLRFVLNPRRTPAPWFLPGSARPFSLPHRTGQQNGSMP